MRTYEQRFGISEPAAFQAFEQAYQKAQALIADKRYHDLNEAQIFAITHYNHFFAESHGQALSQPPVEDFPQELIDRLYQYAVENTDEDVLLMLEDLGTYSPNALDSIYRNVRQYCLYDEKLEKRLLFMIKHKLSPSEAEINHDFLVLINMFNVPKKEDLLALFFTNDVHKISTDVMFEALVTAITQNDEVKIQQLNTILSAQPQPVSFYKDVFKLATIFKAIKPTSMLDLTSLLTSDEAKQAALDNLPFEDKVAMSEPDDLLRMLVNEEQNMGAASWACFRIVIQQHLDKFPEESRPILLAISDTMENLIELRQWDIGVATQAQNCMNVLQMAATDLISEDPEKRKNCVAAHKDAIQTTFETAYASMASSKAQRAASVKMHFCISMMFPLYGIVISISLGLRSVHNKYKYGTFDPLITSQQKLVKDSAQKLRGKLTEIKGDDEPDAPKKGNRLT